MGVMVMITAVITRLFCFFSWRSNYKTLFYKYFIPHVNILTKQKYFICILYLMHYGYKQTLQSAISISCKEICLSQLLKNTIYYFQIHCLFKLILMKALVKHLYMQKNTEFLDLAVKYCQFLFSFLYRIKVQVVKKSVIFYSFRQCSSLAI